MHDLVVIHDIRFQEHKMPDGHPESSLRVKTLESLFSEASVFAKLPTLDFKAVAMDELELIHTPSHIEKIARTKGRASSQLDPDTHTSSKSFETALLAVGSVRRMIDAIMTDECKQAFALVRPPGHHAESNRAMGFCLFNNVAFGAAYARRAYGLQKILIVDWDVHHGNGTQEIFWRDPQVLYLSTHQFPFYPGTGNFHEVGDGPGKGFSVNIPLPAGLGDLEFQEIFEQIVSPIVQAYQPELILISAGYDAYIRDPLGGEAVTEKGFARLTQIMKDLAQCLCQGRLAMVLEGGYSLEGLKSCVQASIEVLLGKAAEPLSGAAMERNSGLISRVKAVQKEYWRI